MQQDSTSNSSTNGHKYECAFCNDIGVIYDKESNSGRPCDCNEIKRNRQILESCGLDADFRNKNFDNYQLWNSASKRFKNMALAYVEKINSGCGTSIAFLGQSGAGKSHLSFAIAGALIKNNIPVLYMPYVDKIQELKNMNRYADENEDFHKTMIRYKTVKVLLIDDLFKGASDKYGNVNNVDVRHIFNIINERALRKLPIIFSSEYFIDEIIRIDEALGGRIVELCDNGNFIGIAKKDTSHNFRLKGLF